MSSVRKRGKTWTAQVRITGWRSFTKTFNTKSDAIVWSKTLKDKLKSIPLPDNNIDNLKLKDLVKNLETKIEIIVTFLALLEMIKQSEIICSQKENFEDIEIKLIIAEA